MGFSHLGLALGVPHLKTTSTIPLPSLTNPVAAWSAHENDAANLWQDTGKTTQAASDGDVIGAIEQLSGFGSTDATQTTTASKPLLKTGANGINGHWAAQFDGSDDLLLATGVTASSGAKTFYIVAKPTSTAISQHFFDSQTGRLIIAQSRAAGGVAYYDGTDHVIAAATTDIQILTFVLGSGSGEVFRNSVSLGTDTYTDKAIGGTTAIGNDGASPSEAYNGLIGAIYIYNAEHSTAERQSMEAHLASKWGISI